MLTNWIIVSIPVVEMNFVATIMCCASTLEVDWSSSGDGEGWTFLWSIIVIIGTYNTSEVCGGELISRAIGNNLVSRRYLIKETSQAFVKALSFLWGQLESWGNLGYW